MANATPIIITDASVTADIQNPTTQKLTNLFLPTADTEVSHTFVTNLKRFLLRSRQGAILKFSLVLGDSGSKYLTVKPGAVYSSGDIDLAADTLYIQGSIISTVEIEEWS